MEKKLKIGIIGCGGIANGKHMPSLAKVSQCEMVAFCDIIVDRAEAAAKKEKKTTKKEAVVEAEVKEEKAAKKKEFFYIYG